MINAIPDHILTTHLPDDEVPSSREVDYGFISSPLDKEVETYEFQQRVNQQLKQAQAKMKHRLHCTCRDCKPDKHGPTLTQQAEQFHAKGERKISSPDREIDRLNVAHAETLRHR